VLPKTPTRAKSLNSDELVSKTKLTGTSSAQVIAESTADGGVRHQNSHSATSLVCCRLDPSSLTLHEPLGSGQFGQVFRGTYKSLTGATQTTIEVAIKRLKEPGEGKDEAVSESESADVIARHFMREATIMHRFDHPHIIKLIGYTEEPLALVLELAKFGQLRSYLHANREHIELATLLSYCYQLSSAMSYLEANGYVK
jgi:serine/threonine protein kinase